MLIYLNTAGSHGDVHPFLAIGRELVARGHEVVAFVHPYFQTDVAEAGLGHVPTCPEFDVEAAMTNPDIFHPRKGGRIIMDMIFEAAPSAVATIRRELESRRPDVMVAHHICFGTPWLCGEFEVPIATGILAPLFWLSPDDPVPTMQKAPGAVREMIARIALRVLTPPFSWYGDRMINRLRRRTGFPPTRGCFLRSFFGGDANLGLWSPHFRAPTAHDPPAGTICGFPWYDRHHVEPELDTDLEHFLADGEPPIVFTLGTAAVNMPGDYFEVAIEACRALGRRGVLLTGRRNETPRDLPTFIHASRYAPFSLLLGRGCATVHHAGIGSSAQAMRAGRPSVAVPHAHDQFNNALRLTRLGAGAMLDRRKLNATRLAAALRSVLEGDAVLGASAALGARLRNEDGAAIAADVIERLARR